MKYLPYGLFSLATILLDQLSKHLVLKNFQPYERLNMIPHFFDLTLVFNQGAAFSFLANMGGIQKWIFTALAFIISAWLIREMLKNTFEQLGNWGASMIIGGAMGNVIDRFMHGQVVDFLLFYWHEHYYPAFNVADSFICLGAFFLIVESFTKSKRKQ